MFTCYIGGDCSKILKKQKYWNITLSVILKLFVFLFLFLFFFLFFFFFIFLFISTYDVI